MTRIVKKVSDETTPHTELTKGKDLGTLPARIEEAFYLKHAVIAKDVWKPT